AVEAGAANLIEIFADFRVDVPRQLALVARLNGIALHEPLGETDHAEFEAATEIDRGAGSARHLDAAAADVEDDGDVARHTDAVDRREMDEAGFLRPRDDARQDAGLLRHGLQELAAVVRLAGRAGGDGDDVVDF